MEAIASEAAKGTSSAREAVRRLGLPPSSDRNILRRILQLYPYKLQSCHELLPADTAQREAFAKWAFSKWNRIPPGFLTSLGQMKLISRFMVTLITITVAFGRPLIHCPVNGWITETVNAQRYLTLLRETVVPCLIQRGQISNVTFMQDGANSHTDNQVKAFLIQTFGEDRIVSRHCRYPWPPRSPDLTPADFWLWGYLKSRVYLSGPSSLSELKDAIHREVSSIHPDMLHSAVAGFVTRLECLLPCGGGHVEHILLFKNHGSECSRIPEKEDSGIQWRNNTALSFCKVSEISGLEGFCLSEGSLAVGKNATYYNGKVLAVCEATMHLLSAGLTPAKVVFFIDSQSATLALSSNTPTDCLYTIHFRTKIEELISYG
ncbi:uncharacterized protein TNCV_4719541 [Trichonephila clavipes]|uniref:Transposase n=1 Tax=Trichonephila clavipes TaxID=2585209 RepID=A0A8X6W5U1_TRICX|nr:uncharacterized protein TNCV_4719541 [Trichonephila clavipes]